MQYERHGPRRSAAGTTCAALLLLSGCAFTDTSAWTDQVAPSGPCYDVNLLDGLDTTATTELHQVYACLAAGGGLEGFRPVDEAWDTDTRDGPAGLVVARWLADADTTGTSLRGLLDAARSAVEDPTPLWDTVHLGLELTYGVAWADLGSVAAEDPSVLGAGLLAPAQLLVGDVATVVLDRPDTTEPLQDFLASDDLVRLAWTVEGVARSPEAALVVLATRWPDDVAALIAAVQSPENDRAPGASGNSLADFLSSLLVRQGADGRPNWEALGSAAAPILRDDEAGEAVRRRLQTAFDRGDLARLPDQVLYLLEVDANADPLDADAVSAIAALARLLRNGNTEVTCTVDLGFTEVDINLGNLSVSLLTAFAGLDPTTAESGVGLFGALLGVPLTDDALDLVAESGVCPVVDATFVADLHAIDRLTDPQADAVLPVLIDLLGALEPHIPDLVNTVSVVWDAGLMPPLEDVLRDALGGPLLADLIPALPALLDPTGWYDTAAMPAGVRPVDWATAWQWAGALLDPAGPLPTLQPLVDTLVGSRSTWLLAERAGVLLADPDAVVRTVLPRIADAVEADPTLTGPEALADLLADADALRPLLVLAEADGLRAALMSTSVAEPGPVPTVTAWTLDGTLDRALGAVSTLLNLLDAESR